MTEIVNVWCHNLLSLLSVNSRSTCFGSNMQLHKTTDLLIMHLVLLAKLDLLIITLNATPKTLGRACSDEDVILEAPSYAINFFIPFGCLWSVQKFI